MGDELVHHEAALEVVPHEAHHLGTALDAAKGTALPDAARDELERCADGLVQRNRGRMGRDAAYGEWKSPDRRRRRR